MYVPVVGSYDSAMRRTVEIRGVPETVLRRLRAHASAQGIALSDYLRQELARAADMPTSSEIRARLEALGPAGVRTPPADVVRVIRDASDI
jgi:hypothetical protein